MRKIIRHILLLLIRVLGTPRAHAAAKRTRQPVSQQPKILLIHPGPLGALVLTTPVLHALKASIPGVHVTMAVGPWSSEVVAHHPGLDRLLIYNFPSYRADSGPLHLAAALDTPTVRIFGPTDPRRYRVWGPQEMHAIVITTHRCSTCPSIPCGRLHFQAQELASHPCVRLVSEQRVLAATFELWSFIKQPTDSSSVGLSAAEKRSRG